MREYLVIGVSFEGYTCSEKMEIEPHETAKDIVEAFTEKKGISDDSLDEVLITDSNLDIRVLRREDNNWL